jgi:hypothetical protein
MAKMLALVILVVLMVLIFAFILMWAVYAYNQNQEPTWTDRVGKMMGYRHRKRCMCGGHDQRNCRCHSTR